jgi:hypothetical protein
MMAAVDAYSGPSGLLVVAGLAAALVFTAVLVWVRWRTCLDERGDDDRREGDDRLDAGGAGRLEPAGAEGPDAGDPAGRDQAGDPDRERRGAKVGVGGPEGG